MSVLPENILIFLQSYGYWAILAACLLAGPVGAIAGGFLAGVGVFNGYVIWLISSLSDIATDVFYYYVGRLGGKKLFERLQRVFHWPEVLIKKVEWLFNKHGRKTLVMIKFTQGIGTLTQVLAGSVSMPLRVFIPYNFFSGVVYNGLLILLGLAAGAAWEIWANRIERIGWALGLAALVLMIAVLSLV